MTILSGVSSAILPVVFISILLYGHFKGVKVYEAFVSGARDGLMVALRLVPYLIAIFAAIGLFRDSGAMHLTAGLLKPVLGPLGLPVDVIPMAVVRPLSGSAGLGILADIIRQRGPDSSTGFLAGIMHGSTETTFYVLTVYFGSVAIRDTRHTLAAGLLADATAFAAAVLLHRLFI